MQILRLAWLTWLTAPLLVGVAGCGGGTDPASLVRVDGRVTYQGKPLTCGTIVFVPDPMRGNTGPLASATIQRDGSFVLSTGDAAGAAPGWHRVTIVALEENPRPEPGQSFSLPRSLLPDRYSDPDLSGLSWEVKAGQENHASFDLD